MLNYLTLLRGKVKLPRILGGLIAGILLGPSLLNIVQSSTILEVFSTLGIVFIMFLAGMETNFKTFFSNTKKYFTIAIIGIIIPLTLGYLISTFFIHDFSTNLFLGVVITATSVSITVETLMQTEKLHTKVGMAILGAGVVDDVIGIIFLSIIMNGGDISFASLTLTIAKVFVFFIIAGAIGFIIFRIFEWLELSNKNNDKIPTFSLAFALILSFFAERLGVSGIIGAYIAGLIIGNTKKGADIKPKIELVVFLIFAPVFFASMGLKLDTLSFSLNNWIFIIILAITAILSKLIGCGLGAKLSGYSKEEAIKIGIGMTARGEVALIMLDEALELGIITNEIFSMVLVSIIIITLITPVCLQLSLKNIKTEMKTET